MENGINIALYITYRNHIAKRILPWPTLEIICSMSIKRYNLKQVQVHRYITDKQHTISAEEAAGQVHEEGLNTIQ